MNRQLLTSVCNQIYRRFPEVNGVQPKIQVRPEANTLLIFSGTAKAADGRHIPRIIRVVVSPVGKIIRVTTSR